MNSSFEDLTHPDMHGNRCPSVRFSSRLRKREHVEVATERSVSLRGVLVDLIY